MTSCGQPARAFRAAVPRRFPLPSRHPLRFLTPAASSGIDQADFDRQSAVWPRQTAQSAWWAGLVSQPTCERGARLTSPCGGIEETDMGGLSGAPERFPEPVPTDAGGRELALAPMAQASSEDLHLAVHRCEFPVVVWSPPEGTILLANEAAAALVNVPLERLVGRRVFDFLSPRPSVEQLAAIIAAGDVDAVDRHAPAPPGGNGGHRHSVLDSRHRAGRLDAAASPCSSRKAKYPRSAGIRRHRGVT